VGRSWEILYTPKLNLPYNCYWWIVDPRANL